MNKTVFFGALTAASVVAGAGFAQTLDNVRAAGELKCGVSTGLVGFAAPDASGRWEGFDVTFCRAMAAAVLGDGEKIAFTPTTGKTRFTALASGEVDVLGKGSGRRDGLHPDRDNDRVEPCGFLPFEQHLV